MAGAALILAALLGVGLQDIPVKVASPPPPAPAEPSPEWYQQVRMKIARLQHYPSDAREQQLEGNVVLYLRIRRDGTLSSVHVQRSSGYVVLDQSAVETARRAAPFDPLPADAPATVNVTLPMAFRL